MHRFAPLLALGLALGGCSDKNGSPKTDPGPVSQTPPISQEPTSPDPATPKPAGAIEPGHVGGGTTTEVGLVTQIRPLVYNLHGGDPLEVAVHWQHEDGPILQDEPPRTLDRVATVASLTIALTMPDGTRHDLRADSKDLSAQQRYDYGLYFAPTLILTIGPDGLRDRSDIGGPWKGTAPAWSTGTFEVAVRGTIVLEGGGAIDFASDAVTIATGADGVLPNAELVARATEVLRSHVPDVQTASGYGYTATESGFVSDLVLEVTKGQRVVRFAQANPAWSYELHSVTVDPEGNELAFETTSIKTCVAEGTSIATPRGPVAVEDLRHGDEVWSWDLETGERVTARVQEIRTGLRSDTIWLADGLRITPDHPVYAGGAWIRAGDVDEGVAMLALDGRGVEARARTAAPGAVRVFDVTVDGPHNFFAGGLLVHNKDRGYWPKLDDPWFFMWDPNYR